MIGKWFQYQTKYTITGKNADSSEEMNWVCLQNQSVRITKWYQGRSNGGGGA